MDDQKLRDYGQYRMGRLEYGICLGLALGGLGILAELFYRSFWIWVLISPAALVCPKLVVKHRIKRQQWELLMQFKEALYVISASLTAGKSVEMAFRAALSDLRVLYIDPETPILRELEVIIRRMELNGTLEEALRHFSNRSRLDDVRSFTDVFVTCKRRGGNLVEVIRNTSETIADKIRTRQEIETLMAEKRMEQKVLGIMPIVMIFILNASSPEFMEPVYGTLAGRLGMTVAVLLFAAAYWLSDRIMQIEV